MNTAPSLRRAIAPVAALLLLTACGSSSEPTGGASDAAVDGPLAELYEAAEGQGPVVWYESTPEDQMLPLIEAFDAAFPGIGLEHVRLEAGTSVAARIVQEQEAGAETADIGTSGPDTINELKERDLLAEVTADELMIDEQLLLDGSSLLATSASMYVGLYNSDLVDEADAPAEWADFLDEQWAGQIGTWTRAPATANLAAEWGEDEALQYVTDLAALNPRLYPSTFPLATDVGAGELPIALGIYHTAQPPIEAGAPIEIVFLEPTPMSTITSGLVADSPNLDAAKLFAAWLHSDEGARIYEEATGRGTPLLDTETAETFSEYTLTEWSVDELQTLNDTLEQHEQILRDGGEEVEG